MKGKIFVFLLAMILICTSCGSKNTDISSSCDFPASTNPTTEQFADGYEDFGIDVEIEEDYSNIIAFTEFESYTKEVKEINITIMNENVGKGFYFYMIPFIEKFENGQWVRMDYRPPTFQQEQQWAFCGVENNSTIKYSTMNIILTEYLNEPFEIGEYRVVNFVGKTVVYAPFQIIA